MLYCIPFVLAAGLSGFLNGKINLALVEMKSFLLQLVYLCILVLISRPYGFCKKSVLIVYFTISLICITQALLGWPYVSDRIFEHSYLPILRVQGFMDDPNYFAMYFVLLSLLFLPMLQKASSQKLVMVMTAIIIIMTGSRAALLVYMITVSIFFLLHNSKRSKNTFWSIFSFKNNVFLLLTLSGFLALIQFNLLPNEISKLFNPSNYLMTAERSSLVNRFYVQNFALSESIMRPFWGHGPRSLAVNIGIKGTNLNFGGNSHNSYIEILYSYGYLVFALYCGYLIYFYKRLKGSSPDLDTKHAFLVYVFLIIMSLFLVVYFSRVYAFGLWVCWHNLKFSRLQSNKMCA